MVLKPALRIAITNKCNMNCQYCPKDGDSYLIKGPTLELNDFHRIIKIAYESGIRCYSLTGGEPLIIPSITLPIAKVIKTFPDLDYLKLNTNGVFLEKYVQELNDIGFDEIKVSLDTIKSKTSRVISHYQTNVDLILKGINASLKYKLPVRLQVVVTKNNFNEIDDIVDYCDKTGIGLKLFDLTYYQDSISSSSSFWQENYVSLSQISDKLEKKYGPFKILHSVGNYGHPNRIFFTSKGTRIMLRDTEISAHYSSVCKKCQNYMCQDGLCTLTLSADGRIKICRPNGIDLGLNLTNSDGTLKSSDEIRQLFNKALKIFNNAREIKRDFSKINLPSLTANKN